MTAGGVLTILHGSDLQHGRPYRPEAGAAFAGLARSLAPDLIVVAGDLTQRAKAREFRAARAFLDGLGGAPCVVTPGNHDVPLYRVWERLLDPYRNWRRFVAQELDSVTRVEGATAVALNSSAPRRAIVAGRLERDQIAYARRAFEGAAPGDVLVLVVHHHFVPPPDGSGGRPLRRAAGLARAIEEMGVDVVLGGHVHRTHVETTRRLLPGPTHDPGVPLVACGTTTSWRGRGPEAGENSLNVIRIGAREIEVVPHRLRRGGGGFEADAALRFPRRSGPVTGTGKV